MERGWGSAVGRFCETAPRFGGSQNRPTADFFETPATAGSRRLEVGGHLPWKSFFDCRGGNTIMPDLLKWDGHTHTEFCLHGSGEPAELMIRRAIELGFERYSLTEHPPLPDGFEDPVPDKSCGISWQALDQYLATAWELKKKYSAQIEIRVGLEVDFIPGFETETRRLLEYCGERLEDGILSVHFLPGGDRWRCVDHSAEDFEEGLLRHYGSLEAVYETYWEVVRQSVLAELGPNQPRRMGHLNLPQKFQKKFPLADPFQFRPQILEVLDLMQERSLELDLDAAGLVKPDCGEVYPAGWIIAEAHKRGIPLVYGSDTHSLKGVGQRFQEVSGLAARLGE
jgi:histidinol-phosphatase (PHP family)